TSYTDFTNELGYSRAIIASNVAELTQDGGAFRRAGQSKYEAAFDFDTKHGLPVYHFLRVEPFNGIRLTGNDVLFVSNVIRHYLNADRAQKYFIGGEIRVASFLGTVESTAHGVINRVLKAGILHRFVLHDGKLDTGKGINGDYQTVYVVDDKILKRVKEIRKAVNKAQAKKNALKSLFTGKSEQKNQRDDVHYDKYALATLDEQKYEKLEVAFACDETYQNIKRRYAKLRADWLNMFKNDPTRADELEVEMNNVADELEAYIRSRGAPPGDIPADLGKYIK
ncbi:MAG: hypothetical protein K2J83_06160, partial [Clostridia bacterium]|nr:hypothetical protein [Clostridia bacterium]